MELDVAVGRRIETLRVDAGLSQDELSERLRESGLNWSQGTLSRVETGARPVRFVEALTVAAVLRVDLLDLTPTGGGLMVAYQRQIQVLEDARIAASTAAHQRNDADATARLLRLALELSQGSKSNYVLHIQPHQFLHHLAYALGPGLAMPEMFRLLGADPALMTSGLEQVEADIAAGFDPAPAYAPHDFALVMAAFGNVEEGTEEHAEKVADARYHLEKGIVDAVFAKAFPNVRCDADPKAGRTMMEWPRPVVDGIDAADLEQPLRHPPAIRSVHFAR